MCNYGPSLSFSRVCQQALLPMGPLQVPLKAGGNGKIIQREREGTKRMDFWSAAPVAFGILRVRFPSCLWPSPMGRKAKGTLSSSLGFFGRSRYDLLFICFYILVASNSWKQVGRRGKEGAVAQVGLLGLPERQLSHGAGWRARTLQAGRVTTRWRALPVTGGSSAGLD